MKVVFLQEVEGSGHTGEVKNVADGFARNFLLPRKLAAPASDHNIRIAQGRAGVEAKHQAKLDADASVLAERLVGHVVTLTAKAGPQGRLYGSVTARDIAEALEGPLGHVLEHRQVELAEAIRQVGVFDVPLRLSRNVKATVQVEVLGEGMPPTAPAAEPVSAEPEPVVEEAEAAVEEPAAVALEEPVAEAEEPEPVAEEVEPLTEEPEPVAAAEEPEPVAEEALVEEAEESGEEG